MTKKQKSGWASLKEKVMVFLIGKRITILGARATGKTRLINFLKTETVPPVGTEEPSEGEPAKPGFKVEIAGVELYIADTHDIPGGEGFFDDWKERAVNADYIIYLFRVDRVNKDKKKKNTVERIKLDSELLGAWTKERKKTKFVLVGTHSDLESSYSEKGTWDKNDKSFRDRLKADTIVKDAILALRNGAPERSVEVVVGSMLTKESTEKLAGEIFKKIDKWNK